jgi:predicted O-linked N-acetylglucosamine transferase (SPINDLY family)
MEIASIHPMSSDCTQAHTALLKQNYPLAASLYKQIIQTQHPPSAAYWHLGLALLLQGQEVEAQTTWLLAMVDGTPAQIDQWTAELCQILEAEATRQTVALNYGVAWSIRQHLREIEPDGVVNVLRILELSVRQGTLTGEEMVHSGVVPLLQTVSLPTNAIAPSDLLQLLKSVLTIPPHPVIVDFAVALLPHIPNAAAYESVLLSGALNIAADQRQPELAINLLETYVDCAADPAEVLSYLPQLYQQIDDYEGAIAAARKLVALSPSLVSKVIATYILLRSLMVAGGFWLEAEAALASYRSLLAQLLQEQPQDISPENTLILINTGFFLPYFQDDLSTHRSLQNQLAQICQMNVRQFGAEPIELFRQKIAARHPTFRHPDAPSKKLKIGYLSQCLSRHSVGWLARWLLHHHNHDQFSIHGYFLKNFSDDSLHDWYLNHVDHVCRLGIDCESGTLALAEQIYQDEIDILVDLDSVTAPNTCDLLTLKPAPIQVTWLGWDASGLDTIDYFLADPYVLPEGAQAHYTEKIWRLPHTYIAVDGFEIGVPTLRRDTLNLPADAVVYLSAQTAYKRHPEITRLQLQIIRAVPNSYFLIKGLGHKEAIQSFFLELAEEIGVPSDRLLFLPDVPLEASHRANLCVADVVLDTFPYNGATTTMETLWMGLPLVTRVGNQFASRNSYAMLKNAGIEEGIAWTDAEYVEWGVRLGKDPNLRQQVAAKLRRSRQTSPLWNAAAFTRDVETAYQQMWDIYAQNGKN